MGPDTAETFRPRIYVACLAAYNSGTLHGAWVDITEDESATWDAIRAILNASPVADAEEWAIHDHEGFAGVAIGEYSEIARIHEIAAMLMKQGELAAIALGYTGGDIEEARAMIEDRYLGSFESLADYMEEVTEDALQIPEHLRFYIDWERMARDADMGGDVIAIEAGWNTIHVFMAQ